MSSLGPSCDPYPDMKLIFCLSRISLKISAGTRKRKKKTNQTLSGSIYFPEGISGLLSRYMGPDFFLIK